MHSFCVFDYLDFLCDVLSQKFLIEFEIRLNLEDSVSELDVERNREIMLILMAASRCKLTDRTQCGHALNDFLEEFSVGTDLMKK